MLRTLLLSLLLATSATAFAQLYRWVDKDGRVHYTATPPPAGAKQSRTLATPAAPPAGASTDSDAVAKEDAAPKSPVTPAEQEAAFRKRQLEAQKAAEKAELARKEAQAKQQNCTRAQEYLRTLESGQRVTRTNAQGEREFIDDATRARETASARQAVQDWCN